MRLRSKLMLITAAASVVPGVLIGWVLARCRFPGRALLDAVVHAPLVLPPVVTGYLLLLLLGRHGLIGGFLHDALGIDIAFTTWAAVIAAAVMGFPLLVRSVRLAIELVDVRLEDAARTLGARRKRPESMLAHVVKDFRQGRIHEVTERDLILVNGEHYGYIVGAGLIVNFLRLYYSGKNPGPLRAFWLLGRLGVSNIFKTSLIGSVVKPFHADVLCDGERVPFRSFSIFLASTVAHIGLGVRPFYLSARKVGWYHVLAGPSTPSQLLRSLWRFFRGFLYFIVR